MKVTLSHIIDNLEKQIDSSQKLTTKVQNIGLPRIQVEIIAELAFLRIFIAWERFLEDSFLRYLVGAESPSGYSPRRYVNAPNLQIAIKLVAAQREYVKWNSPGEVIARSEIYFRDGEPYRNILLGATTEINDMNTIRNRIAHRSSLSEIKFNDLVRRQFGHGVPGMTPGRFLLSPNSSVSQTTFFVHYIQIVRAAGQHIVR